MLRKKKTRTPIVSDSHDWYVRVPEQPEHNRSLANRDQCRAYKKFIETLGYEAHYIKREYSAPKSEGGFIQSEEVMS